MILDRQRDDLFVAIWISEVTLHVSPHKYLNLAPDLAQVLILDPEVSCLEGGGGRKEPLVKLSFNFVKVFTWVAQDDDHDDHHDHDNSIAMVIMIIKMVTMAITMIS